MKFFILFILLYTSLFANKIYVISNQDIPTSKKELQKFFAAKSDYVNGQKFLRISNKEALESLANLAFSISKRKLSKKWIKQNFRKGTPFPISIKNNLKTIEWVKKHPSTIGFISEKTKDVHIIYVFDE